MLGVLSVPTPPIHLTLTPSLPRHIPAMIHCLPSLPHSVPQGSDSYALHHPDALALWLPVDSSQWKIEHEIGGQRERGWGISSPDPSFYGCSSSGRSCILT